MQNELIALPWGSASQFLSFAHRTEQFSPCRNTSYIWEVCGSNIGWGTGFPDWNFSSFFSVPPGECQNNISIRPRLFPSKFFPTNLSTYHLILYLSLATDRVCHIRWSDRRLSRKKTLHFNVAEPSKRNIILRGGKRSKCESCKRDEELKWLRQK